MKRFTYRSGDEIRAGDHIAYHTEPGTVEFVVTAKSGDAAMDWYAEQYPGGGFMITAKDFGNVFLTEKDIDEDLELVRRAAAA
ncbi:MAG TPA: hypothetical protein VGY99_30560 [Candidatus Binataceae bacterium]|jgi:hypothetical protein|nr:hypothetical protein [Candidatus Binataceae bacterium]